jgi:hypothetical protein
VVASGAPVGPPVHGAPHSGQNRPGAAISLLHDTQTGMACEGISLSPCRKAGFGGRYLAQRRQALQIKLTQKQERAEQIEWRPVGILPQRRRDVAAVDRQHRAGGLAGESQGHECVGYVLCADLAAKQIAGHVVVLAQSSRS